MWTELAACRPCPKPWPHPHHPRGQKHKNLCFTGMVAQMVKNPPAVQETRVQSLGWEDPLEKRMATHSSILAWRTPRTEEPGGLRVCGFAKSRTRLSNNTFTAICKTETASPTLQSSCGDRMVKQILSTRGGLFRVMC